MIFAEYNNHKGTKITKFSSVAIFLYLFFVPPLCHRGEFFNERQTRTHERDLPLDEVAARKSFWPVGEDRG